MRLFFSIALITSPLVAAITINPPLNAHVGDVIDLTWTNDPRDPPYWRLFLMNTSQAFDLKADYGVIDPKPQMAQITLPSTLKPSNDYIFYAVNTTNLDWVLGSSGGFTISA